MGANLVGFVLGVDGAQYFLHELIGSWAGMSRPRILERISLIEVPRHPFSPCCMRVFICWRTTHVRVPVCLPLYVLGLALISLA
jgi:hypothetical protein